ncbi:uncharacterized protein PG998_014853 [Apiospora kogelbergensis]|uniref:uncharacterized protein n=1 Tax=Apiospora kogelbergensis TaxID=1337665 RepID=UPI00312D3F43
MGVQVISKGMYDHSVFTELDERILGFPGSVLSCVIINQQHNTFQFKNLEYSKLSTIFNHLSATDTAPCIPYTMSSTQAHHGSDSSRRATPAPSSHKDKSKKKYRKSSKDNKKKQKKQKKQDEALLGEGSQFNGYQGGETYPQDLVID